MKLRGSAHGRVANPRDTTWYRCGLRLALTRTTQFHYVQVFARQDTSLACWPVPFATGRPFEAGSLLACLALSKFADGCAAKNCSITPTVPAPPYPQS